LNLTEQEKAYIAGFIDGEGCITVCQRKSPTNPELFRFQVRLIVTNSNIDVLNWMAERTGVGRVISPTWKAYKANWKPIHRWEVWSMNAKAVLTEIMPYLQIKKDIAETIMNFPIVKGGYRIDKVYQSQLTSLEKIRTLNRRGVLAPVI
jgi:LAGLIDADG endonuclease